MTGKPARSKKTQAQKAPRLEPKPSTHSSLSRNDLRHLERLLLAERARVLKELGYFGENFSTTMKATSGELSAYTFHMADQGTDAMEREKAVLFASAEGRLLYAIDEALGKMYRGEDYGICEECRGEISRERLEAVPHARLCVQCQERSEHEAQRA